MIKKKLNAPYAANNNKMGGATLLDDEATAINRSINVSYQFIAIIS